jgi:hypothetical protein
MYVISRGHDASRGLGGRWGSARGPLFSQLGEGANRMRSGTTGPHRQRQAGHSVWCK